MINNSDISREDFLNGIDDADRMGLYDLYRSGIIQQSLGFTRDALRHYEAIGLISPGLNEDNHYREYSVSDILVLLSIDNYKKHGLELKNIQAILEGASLEELKEMLNQQEEKLLDEIEKKQRLLRQLLNMKNHIANFGTAGEFSIVKLPLFEVLGEWSALTSIKEYPQQVAELSPYEAILPSLMRVVTFNESQYLTSKMVLVSKADEKQKDKTYLEGEECLYCIIHTRQHIDFDSITFEQMHQKIYQWAQEYRRKFKGLVYISVGVLLFGGENEQAFIECWIPLKK